MFNEQAENFHEWKFFCGGQFTREREGDNLKKMAKKDQKSVQAVTSPLRKRQVRKNF